MSLNLLRTACALLLIPFTCALSDAQIAVSTTAQLVSAINSGSPGSTIQIAPGTYEVSGPLRVKSGMTIIGAGINQTIIRNAPAFSFPPQPYYGDDVNFESAVPDRYIFDLGRDQANISLRDMTISGSGATDPFFGGPGVYGAIHFIAVNNVSISNILFQNFLWSGIRGYVGSNWSITNCSFVSAGGQTLSPPPNSTYGATGGSVFLTYLSNSIIDSNYFIRGGRPDNVFGIKGREFRTVRISNNTIRCDFAIELPFENDFFVDILNNDLQGVVSLPRWAGGILPPGPNPYCFLIRNNYFTTSYAIEGPHNGMIVEQNVFNFPVDSDYGNLFSAFGGTPAAPGPLNFNNNIVINPGRGVFWSDNVWNNLSFTNNHIFLNELVPSQYPEGLFSFIDQTPDFPGSITDFSSITIASNRVEILGAPRKLIRYPSGRAANISNNLLINVADTPLLTNPTTGAPRGLLAPLSFNVGVNGEFPVNGADLIARAAPGLCCRGTTCVVVNQAASCVTSAFLLYPARFNPATQVCATFNSHTAGCCAADMDKNGTISVGDIFGFLNAWFAQSPFARWEGNGISSNVSVSDIFSFLAAWFAGC